jgi:HAD domain in Swiss Army Knife RNA repair proteins
MLEMASLSSSNEVHRGGAKVSRPLLMVDIDGVISLFGARLPGVGGTPRSSGSFHSIEGIPHFLSSIAAGHLLSLSSVYEIVWASGWEEKAEEYLPRLLGLPLGLPFLRFPRAVGRANAHWKLETIDTYAQGRPLAWIDDALNDACRRWAQERAAPTLLVQTLPEAGLTESEARRLTGWAAELQVEKG